MQSCHRLVLVMKKKVVDEHCLVSSDEINTTVSVSVDIGIGN